MYAAMSSMSVWRVESADASFAALRMHDLRVSLVEGSTAREGALRSALAGSVAADDVAGAAERLVVSTQVDASTDGRTIIVPGRIVGTPPSADVDTLDIRAGRLASDGRAVALEHNFARHYDLPASGTLTLAGAATRPLYRPGARARVLHRHRARRRFRRRVGVRRRLRATADRPDAGR